MNKIVYLVGIMFLLVICGAVLAHGPGGGQAGSYGGRTESRPVDPFADPVAKDTVPTMSMSVVGQIIRLTVTDSLGEKLDLELAEAKAFVTSGGDMSVVHLLPSGGNVLSGDGRFTAHPDMRVDVTLRLPGRRPINKDFYPMR